VGCGRSFSWPVSVEFGQRGVSAQLERVSFGYDLPQQLAWLALLRPTARPLTPRGARQTMPRNDVVTTILRIAGRRHDWP
jgi:hypothetical protein